MVPGEQVLINGAGGGVGSFAIQMAKRLGAVVTGVDRGSKLDFMRAVGADHVIDFEREDFAASGQRYDLVIDMVARRSTFAHARVLKPGGRYVMIGGTMPRIARDRGAGIADVAGDEPEGRAADLSAERGGSRGDGAAVCGGDVRPVIERSIRWSRSARRCGMWARAGCRGKVVVSVV